MVYVRFELGSAQTWPRSNATRAAREILGPQKIKAPTHRPQKKKKEEGKGGFREYCCAAMQGPARAPSSKAAVSRLSEKWGLGLAFMGVYHTHGRHPIFQFFFGQPHILLDILAPPRLRCTLKQIAPSSRSPKGAKSKQPQGHEFRTTVPSCTGTGFCG